MKFDFDHNEVNVLLISLISRRTDIIGLLGSCSLESSKESYAKELATVESMLEKMFPGSLQIITKAA